MEFFPSHCCLKAAVCPVCPVCPFQAVIFLCEWLCLMLFTEWWPKRDPKVSLWKCLRHEVIFSTGWALKGVFFVISSLTHAHFTRTVFPQFKDFSQGQNKAMGKWVKQNVPGLLVFFRVYHSGFFSLASAQFGSWAYPMKLTGLTWVSLDSHLEVWIFTHKYILSQL